MKRVKLFVNHTEKARKVASELEQELIENGLSNSLRPQLGISVGGDGAFLRMVKQCHFNEKMYFVGIHAGTLGFLQEIDVVRMKDFVSRLKENDYKIKTLNLIEVRVITKMREYVFTALNEVVVRDKEFRTLKLKVEVDSELLEHYVGDGLLISSSTGSTAYNMSFGGAIVYNTLDTLQITPIAPLNNRVYQTLSNSFILPSDKHIILSLEGEYSNLFLSIDGVNKTFQDVVRVETKISDKKLSVLRMQDFHFVRVVHEKLLD